MNDTAATTPDSDPAMSSFEVPKETVHGTTAVPFTITFNCQECRYQNTGCPASCIYKPKYTVTVKQT
jgi:hypothetical protein